MLCTHKYSDADLIQPSFKVKDIASETFFFVHRTPQAKEAAGLGGIAPH
jgi:hypothetical protein